MKVQHKQIRPSDQQHDRSHGHGSSGFDGVGGGRGYGRGHMGAPSLPPSGPMAMNAGWYNNRSMQPNSNMPPEAQNPEDGAVAPTDQSGGAGPLSSLEPLRQNLPEVGGDGDQLN